MDNKINYKYFNFLMNKLNMNKQTEEKISGKISEDIEKIKKQKQQQIQQHQQQQIQLQQQQIQLQQQQIQQIQLHQQNIQQLEEELQHKIEFQEFVNVLKKLDLEEIKEINATEEWKNEIISEIINQNITVRKKQG
jgi:hypothetical protein